MEEKELNLVEHLDELRKRLIITASAFILFLLQALFLWRIFINGW